MALQCTDLEPCITECTLVYEDKCEIRTAKPETRNPPHSTRPSTLYQRKIPSPRRETRNHQTLARGTKLETSNSNPETIAPRP